MADLSGGSGGGGGGAYTYVQDTQPSGPEEGESWYDTAGNAAYVYDGAAWIEQTVADHAGLSGVGSSDHHSRPSGTQNHNPATQNLSWRKYGNNTTDKLHFPMSGFDLEIFNDSGTTTYDYTVEVVRIGGSDISRTYSVGPDSTVTDTVTFTATHVVEASFTFGSTYENTHIDFRPHGAETVTHSHNI